MGSDIQVLMMARKMGLN